MKIKDMNKLKDFKNRFTYDDSRGYHLLNMSTLQILHVYYDGKIEFTNGSFNKANKLIHDLRKANLIEEE